MGINIGDNIKATGTAQAQQFRNKEGRVSGKGNGKGLYLIKFGNNPPVQMMEGRDFEKIEDKGKWDHKHGLSPKGTDYTPAGGATAGAASLGKSKILERISELFGKDVDNRANRLKGLPSHVAALNNELAPPSNRAARDEYDSMKGAFKENESVALQKLVTTAGSIHIDFPPIAVLFPMLGRVLIISRKNGDVVREEDYFSDYGAARGTYAMDANVLGQFYMDHPAYANHAVFSPAAGRWVCTLMESGLVDNY